MGCFCAKRHQVQKFLQHLQREAGAEKELTAPCWELTRVMACVAPQMMSEGSVVEEAG